MLGGRRQGFVIRCVWCWTRAVRLLEAGGGWGSLLGMRGDWRLLCKLYALFPQVFLFYLKFDLLEIKLNFLCFVYFTVLNFLYFRTRVIEMRDSVSVKFEF